jgi:hypothetical protein
VVGGDAIPLHPEDALGGPGVDFGGTKDGAIAAHLERNVTVANEGSNIVFVQVQVRGDFLDAEDTVRHGRNSCL